LFSTVESIEQCKNWFGNSTSKQQTPTRKILVFYCSNDRQPEVLLQPLMVDILTSTFNLFNTYVYIQKCKFDCIVFCSPIASSNIVNNKSQTDTKPGNGNETFLLCLFKI
jgi:hypothetical protein